MRILWICNVPIIKTRKNINVWCGGWMTSTAELLEKRDDMELLVCYPQSESKVFLKERKGRVRICGFYAENKNEYDIRLEEMFRRIDSLYMPEVVHIFGTEYPHAYSAIRVWFDKAVVSVQGLIGVCAKHYLTGIPAKIVYRQNFENRSVYSDLQCLKNRGKYERGTLKYARNIIGRTEWDYACVRLINPEARYFKCNEILRKCFYDGEWKYEACKKHSILISQANYPIKGFHIFLRALKLIKKRFPDVTVIVAGEPLEIGQRTRDSYTDYVIGLIETWNFKKNVKFIGVQSEEKMREQFLKAHVFVLPSLIENSPNSLGEAMILGTPCIASGVGGVNSLMKHGEEGFIYQVDAEYMLAYYVGKIFEDRCMAEKLSGSARVRAHETYNRKINLEELITVYRNVQR